MSGILERIVSVLAREWRALSWAVFLAAVLHGSLTWARERYFVAAFEDPRLAHDLDLYASLTLQWDVSLFVIDWVAGVFLGAMVCAAALGASSGRLLPRMGRRFLAFAGWMLLIDGVYRLALWNLLPALIASYPDNGELAAYLNEGGAMVLDSLVISLHPLVILAPITLLVVHIFVLAPGYCSPGERVPGPLAAWRASEPLWLGLYGAFLLVEITIRIFDFLYFDLLWSRGIYALLDWAAWSWQMENDGTLQRLVQTALDSLYFMATGALWYAALAVLYQRVFQAERPLRASAG